MVVSEEQPLKQQNPIEISEFGSEMVLSEEQPEKQ
jgi:hypothetical protein